MNILIFVFALEIGLLPEGHLSMTDVSEYTYDLNYSLYVQFECELQFFDMLFIGGKIYSPFWKKYGEPGFAPDSIEYLFNGGIRFYFIEIGFRHYCKHPVLPWYNSTFSFRPVWEASIDELYIRFQGRTKL